MKSDLTYEELHRQLFYDPLTGILIWKISNKNRVKKKEILQEQSITDTLKLELREKYIKLIV